MNNKALAAFCLCLFCAAPALADDALVHAHPAVWHIRTLYNEITLLGSVHMLPAEMDWVTPDVAHAVRRADVFVFEVPTDGSSRASLNGMLSARGSLPEGQSLRAMLPPDVWADYDSAIASEHLSPNITDHEQPWLASLQLSLADTMNHKYYPDAGVDYVMMDWANNHNRQVRYLETVDQQLAMLMPGQNNAQSDAQLDSFVSTLKQVSHGQTQFDPMIQAWSQGDANKLASLIDADFGSNPAEKKRLLLDRNRNWAGQIEQMALQQHNFFITVGAAHLAGPDGVPALLRKDGYVVDGP
jgi:uncharacterized protein YbaP (TraB family)